MANIEPEQVAIDQRCPVCRKSPSKPGVVTRNGAIVAVHLICVAGHLWQVKWAAVSAA